MKQSLNAVFPDHKTAKEALYSFSTEVTSLIASVVDYNPDLVQDVFVTLLTNIERYDCKHSFKQFIYYNSMWAKRSERKRIARDLKLKSKFKDSMDGKTWYIQDFDIETEELIDVSKKALERLPADKKSVVEQYTMQDATLKEVAALNNLSIQSVSNKNNQGIEKMRRMTKSAH